MILTLQPFFKKLKIFAATKSEQMNMCALGKTNVRVLEQLLFEAGCLLTFSAFRMGTY